MMLRSNHRRSAITAAGGLGLVALLALGVNGSPEPPPPAREGDAPDSPEGGTPDDPEAAFAKAAWDWFLAINKPLTGPQPKVWESWKQTSVVYLPDGSKPLPWGQDPPLPEPVVKQAKAQGLDLDKPFHNLDTEIQVDGLTLADGFGQNVRYQLLMNQETFDYILDHGFYNVDGQEEAAKQGQPLDFPAGSFELKTSWIWIGDQQSISRQLVNKYYLVNAYYADAQAEGGFQVGQAALTGMHVINKSQPDWVWTTFENEHNPDFTVTNSEPPAPERYELPISPAVEAENQKRRSELRQEGSIFAEYRLNGVQWQFVDADDKPILLASSQIESAFQHSSSCITCHGTASYSVSEGYFSFVEESDGGLTYYTGNPPEKKLEGYNSLDFVWSLKRASRKR